MNITNTLKHLSNEEELVEAWKARHERVIHYGRRAVSHPAEVVYQQTNHKKMILKLKWKYAEGYFDTKSIHMVDIPARPLRGEKDAEICLVDGMNLSIAKIHLGDADSSNMFAKELVRRWNEFPEELKQ